MGRRLLLGVILTITASLARSASADGFEFHSWALESVSRMRSELASLEDLSEENQITQLRQVLPGFEKDLAKMKGPGSMVALHAKQAHELVDVTIEYLADEDDPSYGLFGVGFIASELDQIHETLTRLLPRL